MNTTTAYSKSNENHFLQIQNNSAPKKIKYSKNYDSSSQIMYVPENVENFQENIYGESALNEVANDE
jgi:hypothetical protein